MGIFVGLKDHVRCWSSTSTARSLGHSFDEILGLFQSWVALILELVFVVEEAWVVLEMVSLAIEEGIQLSKVGGVEAFSFGLGSVVSVPVDVLRGLFLALGHVLAIVDLVVLSLAISDLPGVSCADVLVLAQVAANKRSVSPGIVGRAGHLGDESDTEEGAASPAQGHRFKLGCLGDRVGCNKETESPSQSSDAFLCLPELDHVLSILVGHVVGKEVTHIALVVLVHEIVLKTVVLNLHLSEPWST